MVNVTTPTVSGFGGTLERAQALQIFLAFDTGDFARYGSGSNPPQTPGRYRLRYRLVGAGTWTYVSGAEATYLPSTWAGSGVSPTGQQYQYAAKNLATYAITQGHLFAGNFFAAGNYELQASATVHTSVGGTVDSAWSPSYFATFTTPPAAPTITAPAAASTVTAPTATITVTHAASIQAIEYRVMNGAAEEWNSGEVTISDALTSHSTTGQFPTQGARTVQARVKSGGVWSAYASNAVTVTYTNPATPTLTATPTDANSLGMLHALNVVAAHPAPSGGQPTVTLMDVYVRRNGSSDATGVKVLSDQTPTGTKTWLAPAAATYQVRVVAKAADGRSTSSAWTTATAENTIKGTVLYAVTDHAGTIRAYRLNDEAAADEYVPESALIQYAGREHPVVEFGTAGTRTITIDTLHSKGTVPLPGADALALTALVKKRAIVCFRDAGGRKAYGRLKVSPVKDTFYGSVTGLVLEATDYPTDTDVS